MLQGDQGKVGRGWRASSQTGEGSQVLRVSGAFRADRFGVIFPGSALRAVPQIEITDEIFQLPLRKSIFECEYSPMFNQFFPLVFFAQLAFRVEAQQIYESNFDHIDIGIAHVLEAKSIARGILRSPIDVGWLVIASSNGKIVSSKDELGNYFGPAIQGAKSDSGKLVLSFDEAVCTIGFQLKSEYPAATDRSHFSFRFFDLNGTKIERLDRWPARGTTLQGYSAANTDNGFRKVVLDNHDEEAFALREVRVLPCEIRTSVLSGLHSQSKQKALQRS